MRTNLTAADLTPAEILHFWSRLDEADHTGCWPWLGNRSAFGHGQISIRGRHFHAHRLIYELVYGPVTAAAPVLSHLCNNPWCCNPTHLKAGTQRDNLLYMQACGRKPVGDAHWTRQEPHRVLRGNGHYLNQKPRKGEAHNGAKLTEDQVRTIRQRTANGQRIQSKLAIEYGVTQSTINLIVHRKSWTHIE